MIELLPIHLYERDYYEGEPLLDYVKEVADEFWSEIYPARFAERLLNHNISNYKLDEYLDAATEKRHFKHTSFSKLYNNEINNSSSPERGTANSGEIASTLKAYGLDISKFWYLCLMIKDCVEGQTKKGCLVVNATHRSIIKELISQLDQLKPDDYPIPSLKPKDIEMELCLKIKIKGRKNAHNVTITRNSYTLLVIQEALQSFLKINSKRTFKLDSPATNLKQFEFLKEDLSQPVKIALFYHYLIWFLNRQKVNKDYINNSIYSVSTSKNLLVTRMAYYTGLTDNRNFLQKDAYYLRTYISGYEDNKVNTLNAYYDMTDEFQFLLEMIKRT